jgi:PPOX class probable F420-dependent enzyme
VAQLTEKQAKLFTDPNYGWAITLRADGTPHATVVWVDYDGEFVLFNTGTERAKARHIERDPRVTLTVLDANDWRNYVAVSGHAELVYDGAQEHIHALARKYFGEDFDLEASKHRVIVRVTPERITNTPF